MGDCEDTKDVEKGTTILDKVVCVAIMAYMTEEEAARLDKYYTENTVETVRGKPGTFAKHKARMLEFDALSAQYLQVKANADHKSIYEVIGDMVRRELAAAASA